ncbi:hypothetical protein NFI96_017290 [Prochilodus magdalenae]|nr:hypothetical protein NFI96_017290 [Prochilodus magdalenae]
MRTRGTLLHRTAFLTLVLLSVQAFPTLTPKAGEAKPGSSAALRTGGQTGSGDVRRTLAELQQQNQLKSRSPTRRHRRRWSQQRSEGVLPKPAPEEEEPFILDLKNFPDLANADLGSQNPNIQEEPLRGTKVQTPVEYEEEPLRGTKVQTPVEYEEEPLRGTKVQTPVEYEEEPLRGTKVQTPVEYEEEPLRGTKVQTPVEYEEEPLRGTKVTIEVVDDPQMEVEMDLAKEGRNDWSLSSEQWLDHKKLFWPLFWEYHDSSEESPGQASLEENGEDLNYDGEDSLQSGLDWERRWKGWESIENYV